MSAAVSSGKYASGGPGEDNGLPGCVCKKTGSYNSTTPKDAKTLQESGARRPRISGVSAIKTGDNQTLGWILHVQDQGQRLEGSLLFVELLNHHCRYLGLVDSGSQLNLISSSLIRTCKHEEITSSAITHLAGVNGMRTPIKRWARVPFHLPNGHYITLDMAVVPLPSASIILGTPFLYAARAVLDVSAHVLATAKGPIPLLATRKPMDFRVSTVTIADVATPTLTEDNREKLLRVLTEHTAVWDSDRPGRCKGVQHVIRLTTPQHIALKPRRYSPEHVVAIKEEVEEMLKNGVIRPSDSPYSAEIVMVKKQKTGKWRMCMDYRALNQVTVPDCYPFPRISELIRSVQGATHFVALDLRCGYWQIPLEEESKKYTAFRCPAGFYEFNVMPFGLKNAPATFQRSMDVLFKDMLGEGVSIYLDDILIYGATVATTMQRLDAVLTRLEEAKLTINMEKCQFFPKEMTYLGHVIQEGALLPDPRKVEALQHIRPAKTIKEVQSILGMFGFYRSFIPKYAEIAEPLTSVLRGSRKGNSRIYWTAAMQSAVRALAQVLQHAVLTVPVDGDEFLVETDASDWAVGAILSVKRNGTWCPIEFVSKKLTEVEERWPVREKEAFAIIYALNKFDPFVRTRPFTVHTDHQSLKWMLGARTGKVARWASRLAEYDMQVFWKRGKQLEHVDFLSRQIDPDVDIQDRMVYNVTSSAHPFPTLEDVMEAQKAEALPVGRGYLRREDTVYYRNGLWVPPTLRNKLIAACHLLPPFCHCGVKKTKATLLKVFNWPGLHEEVTAYVRSCLPCQRMRPGIERIQGMLKTHPQYGPFEMVYVDFWEGSFDGRKIKLITMIDGFTRWAEAEFVPCHNAEFICDMLIRLWICRFGVPQVLVTDNELGFISDAVHRLTASLGIRQIRTTPYHPQGNALIESFHRVLNQRLPLLETSLPANTSCGIALCLVLWSYRATLHSSTNESPAFMVYGTDMGSPFPQDWRFAQNPAEKDRISFLNQLREDIQLQAYQKRVAENLKKNEQRIPVSVTPGQLVLVRPTPAEKQQAASQVQSAKLLPRWSLPCRVLRASAGSNRVIVRNILTGHTREVHITDIRLIETPKDDTQRNLWDLEVQRALAPSMFDKAVRAKRLKEFWEEVEAPQKRPCVGFDGGE